MRTSLYRHFDARGVLLYVGVSWSAVLRMAQHANGAPWWAQVRKVTISDPYPTRRAALDAELEAIRTERPLHNVKGTHVRHDAHRKAAARALRRPLTARETVVHVDRSTPRSNAPANLYVCDRDELLAMARGAKPWPTKGNICP